MSFAAALADASDRGHNLRLYVTIQGIPYTFHGDANFPSTLLFGTTGLGIVKSINQSETRLNVARRREEGASLTVRMQDDESGTLAALFAPRQYRKAFVTSSVTETGDIDVSSVGRLDAAGTVWIDGEAVTYTSIVGSTLTGCTRGAFSTEAEAHLGGADNGASVFTVPPSWEGRRATLFGYFIPQNVSPQAYAAAALSLQGTLGKFIVSEAPKQVGAVEWELTCGSLIEEFGSKKVGGGYADVQIADENRTTTTNGSGNVELVVGAGANFDQFTLGTPGLTYIKLKAGDRSSIQGVVSLVGTDTVEFTHGAIIADLDGVDVDEARHIGYLPNSGSILWAILSRLGDGANGTYDVLPGFTPSDFGPRGSLRMGAGILEAEVDTDSFIERARAMMWDYYIDEEIDLADLLYDFNLASDSATIISRDGQMKAVPLAEDGTASVMTIDASLVADKAPLLMSYDESQIYPRVEIDLNYDPLSKKYLVHENFFDADLQKRYKHREARLELKSRALVVDREGQNPAGRGSISLPALGDMVRRIQAAEGRGRVFIGPVACHLPVLKAQVGDIVTLDGLTVGDGEGGTVLTLHPARIVAMNPGAYGPTIGVTFQLLDKLWRVAPACTIASRAAAVLTLNTADIGIPDAFPGRMFGDGQAVEIWDVSAGVKADRTVLSHTDTTITLSSAPAFANEANVDFVKLAAQDVVTANASQHGYVGLDFLFEMPDDENDGTPVEVTRWR